MVVGSKFIYYGANDGFENTGSASQTQLCVELCRSIKWWNSRFLKDEASPRTCFGAGACIIVIKSYATRNNPAGRIHPSKAAQSIVMMPTRIMASRSKVPWLALLSMFVITYVGLHLDDFRGSLDFFFEDVQPKVKNGVAPLSSSSSSSSPEIHLGIGSKLPIGVALVVDGNDDHMESSSENQQKWWEQPVLDASSTGNASTTTPSGEHDSNRSTTTTTIITVMMNSDNKTIGSTTTINNREKPACCLRPSVDLEKKLSPEFFHDQRTNGIDPQTKWTGKEYEEWVTILSRLNPTHEDQMYLACPTQYTLLVLEQVSGFYLRTVLTELGKNGKLTWLPYYKETPGLPRILLLGDSISRGIRSQTQQLYHRLANIQGAPTNCYEFARYSSGLQNWLGHCRWDLVQFNVGMHFHPEFPDNYTSWYDDYRQGITNIVNEIRAHSPSAQIVFALTTPSPFDSEGTTPNKATCPQHDLFHKAGFVSAMNEVAISLSEELGIIINDRYSAIFPVLDQYQKKCDVHYDGPGYQLIARQDWKVFSEALSLGN